MNTLILMGSPRKEGNTAALLPAFRRGLEREGSRSEVVWLYDLDIGPCTACRTCQKDWTTFGCRIRDDLHGLFDKILACDLLVLATPIYGWYCTPPMKAALDRLIYGMDKFYGETRGPSLWEGKPVALLTTCGYPPEKGADLWEAGMRRYCKHCKLTFAGALAEHDKGYDHVFLDMEKEKRAEAFGAELCKMQCSKN